MFLYEGCFNVCCKAGQQPQEESVLQGVQWSIHCRLVFQCNVGVSMFQMEYCKFLAAQADYQEVGWASRRLKLREIVYAIY